MDDLCPLNFVLEQCPNGSQCVRAHKFQDLAEPNRWVFFPNVMEQPSVFGQQSRVPHVDRQYILPQIGLVIRCNDMATASVIVNVFNPICGAITLAQYLDLDLVHLVRTPWPLSMVATPEIMPTLFDSRQHHSKPDDDDTFAVWAQLSTELANAQCTPSPEQEQWVSTVSTSECAAQTQSSSSNSPRRSSKETPCSRAWGREPEKKRSQFILQLMKSDPHAVLDHSAGWSILKRMLNLGPEDFEKEALDALKRKPPRQQNQILLTLGCIGLHMAETPTAALVASIADHDRAQQPCLYFLADLCQDPLCSCAHPTGTPAWDKVWERQRKTFKDFDYPCLRDFIRKSPEEQVALLTEFAEFDKPIDNPSAFVNVRIFKLQNGQQSFRNKKKKAHDRKPAPRPPPGNEAPAPPPNPSHSALRPVSTGSQPAPPRRLAAAKPPPPVPPNLRPPNAVIPLPSRFLTGFPGPAYSGPAVDPASGLHDPTILLSRNLAQLRMQPSLQLQVALQATPLANPTGFMPPPLGPPLVGSPFLGPTLGGAAPRMVQVSYPVGGVQVGNAVFPITQQMLVPVFDLQPPQPPQW